MGYCQGALGVTDSTTCSNNGGQWLADPTTGTPSNSSNSGSSFQNWLDANGGFGNVANAINGGLSSLFSFGLGVGQLVNGQPVTAMPGQLPGTQNQNGGTQQNQYGTQSNTAMYVMIAIVIVLIVLAALYLFKQSKVASA